MENQWVLKQVKGDLNNLSRKTKVDELFLKILINRDIKEEKDIIKFFNGDLNDLYEPYLMKDMEKAIRIIQESIDEGKNIVVYGDYDVDGVSSTVILYKGLKRCGANVTYYVPNREEEGYGMCISGIEKLKNQGAEVILTCDNGISAMAEVKYAVDQGIDVIVTDHHQPSYNILENGEKVEVLPPALAVINPHRKGCEYPFKLLCGAAISYKFIQALYRVFNVNNKETLELLQYAAIATVCDVVDLVDENRIIVKEGLKIINNTKSIGLSALLKELNLLDKEIKCYNVGFNIGPCINATGRLETADISIELFLCDDKEKAKELANKLFILNKLRQEMTQESVDDIINRLSENKELDRVLLIYKEDVHESIAGIVAGRVKEHFNLPTFVITKGKDMPKGSGRSIENYNMFEELLKCKELMEKFGGHPMAAGLSLKEENIDKLRMKLNENTTLTEKDITPIIKIDNVLPESYDSSAFMNCIEQLEPFGKGNPKPLFGAKKVQILCANIMGKNSNVLKLKIKIKNKITNAIIFSNGIEKFKEVIGNAYGNQVLQKLFLEETPNVYMDFIFSTDINDFMNRRTLQLKVKDFRVS